MLRPGRLDKMLYVPLPDAESRAKIVLTLSRNTPLASDVDLQSIVRSDQCRGYR